MEGPKPETETPWSGEWPKTWPKDQAVADQAAEQAPDPQVAPAAPVSEGLSWPNGQPGLFGVTISSSLGLSPLRDVSISGFRVSGFGKSKPETTKPETLKPEMETSRSGERPKDDDIVTPKRPDLRQPGPWARS
jgi:hypothetical protein